MKKIYFSILTMVGFSLATYAVGSNTEAESSKNVPGYNRSSLHLVLLTTEDPQIGKTDFSANVSNAWKAYPFPDKYDQIAIDFTEGHGGSPKGSLMELITKYRGRLESLSVDELKEIAQNLKDNKYYEQQLVALTREMLKEKKVGQQLLRQWFNISDDGSYNYKNIIEKSYFGANQSDVADAASTARGKNAIVDKLSDRLISNTFVSFSKLAFYENEPVAAFARDVAYLVSAAIPGPGAIAGKSAADAAYAATSKGYSAYTTNVLYQLKWNDSTMNLFYSTFEGDKINMEKFNALDFPFELLGVQTVTSATVDAKGGLSEAVLGENKSKSDEELIQETIVRNIDKTFAKLQYNYEVFRPVSPIISTEPLLIDLGMKEGIDDKSVFDLLEVVMDETTGEISYKKVASLKVVKGQVWDNRYTLVDDANGQQEVKGTELKKNKKAVPGMLVKQVVKKK